MDVQEVSRESRRRQRVDMLISSIYDLVTAECDAEFKWRMYVPDIRSRFFISYDAGKGSSESGALTESEDAIVRLPR